MPELHGRDAWAVSFGRTNRTHVALDRAAGTRVETATRADGSRMVSTYTNGLLRRVEAYDADDGAVAGMDYTYDGWKRLTATRETAANGESRVTTRGYDLMGQVTSVTVRAGAIVQTTRYDFDIMGRRTRTWLPDGGEVRHVYNPRGELVQESGARIYPVRYGYTDQGLLQTLTTFRDGLDGPGDVTTWQYSPERGWLEAKVYADGTAIRYSHQPNGRVERRTWARGLTTSYRYDAAGGLARIDYSDDTPDIVYQRDRLGRPYIITDALGTRTNAFAAEFQGC